jgi:hypothetical protein
MPRRSQEESIGRRKSKKRRTSNAALQEKLAREI